MHVCVCVYIYIYIYIDIVLEDALRLLQAGDLQVARGLAVICYVRSVLRIYMYLCIYIYIYIYIYI